MTQQIQYKEQVDQSVQELNKYLVQYWFAALMLAASELILALNSTAGIVLHFICFGALVLTSYKTNKDSKRILYLSYTLVPLIRIYSLAMPISELPLTYWYIIISVPLLLSAFMTVRIISFTPQKVGLTTKKLYLQLLIGIIGVPLGWVGSQLSMEIPASTSFQPQFLWLSAIVLIICTGFTEELVFRGIIYQAVLEEMDKKHAWLITSFLNASLYISNLSLVQVIYVFALAAIFTAIYNRNQNLIGISLAHGLVNITLFLIRPVGL